MATEINSVQGKVLYKVSCNYYKSMKEVATQILINESSFKSEKNILGMMPHPERLIDSLLSGEDGSILFKSLSKKN